MSTRPPAEHESPRNVLASSRQALETAYLGLDDFRDARTPARRRAGLRNAVVWGRIVTFALQNLRQFTHLSFNDWYDLRRAELIQNPEFAYLSALRTDIEHKGSLAPTRSTTHIRHFSTNDLARLPRPPGVRGFFIGDRIGGNGWVIELPDGSTENYYVDLPSEIDATSSTYFVQVTVDKGLPPPLRPIDAVLSDYLAYLRSLLDEATALFGHL